MVGARLQRPAGQVDVRTGYYEMGLDSATMLQVVSDIQARVGQPLSPILPFEYTNIASLAAHLAEAYPQHFAAGSPALLASKPVAPAPAASAPTQPTQQGGGDIAIIGLGGRFPGAADIAQFWDNLCQGVDAVTEVPPERWDWRRFAAVRSASGKPVSRWGGFIDGVDRFDAKFFRITPIEAALMDPQERLFLEVCWETIEDAGYTPETLVPARGQSGRRRAGVFVGVMHKDYTLVGMDAADPAAPMPLSLNSAPIANRVSYACNLHGPSMAVDTVCSSSLTALHLAVQSIRSGESEVALAGGVNLSLHPAKYLTYGVAEFHATDGRCRAFGAGGDGYVSAEGVGAVLLKPLHAAERDGDHIYAVIKGSAINHGGAGSGVTVPNPVAQAEMIEACLEHAGVDARTISYVEAHGTGTSLGDPIELQGLVKAFAKHTDERQFCALGSLKSNIGHAEGAAGIGGLIKTALQLHHQTLVASLHAQELNPHIDFEPTPFYVQTRTTPWQRPARAGVEALPRRAGISAFGASGSNAHVILEEYLPKEDTAPAADLGGRTWIVPLSAKSEERLQEYARRLLRFLERQDERAPIRLADLAYTLQCGRVALAERLAFTVASLAELREQLARYLDPARAPADQGSNARSYRGRAVPAPADAPAATGVAALADYWTCGGQVDWAALHAGQRLRRVSLPTYPFARERFWIGGQATTPAPQEQRQTGEVLLLAPSWRPQPGARSAATPRYQAHWAILCGATPACAHRLQELMPQLRCRAISIDSDGTLASAFSAAAASVFALVKELLLAQPAGEVLVQVVVPNAGAGQLLAGLAGLLRTARLEAPRLIGQVIEVDALDDAPALAATLDHESGHPADQRIRYADGQRWTETLEELAGAGEAPPWKEGGVYLMSGGAGGLGLLFAEELARQVASRLKRATLVLTGRSAPGEAQRRRIEALAGAGLRVEYRQADITQRSAVRALVDDIVQRHGALHGILHSAGVIRDNFIIRKSAEEFAAVLAPKVDGLVHLDEVTRAQPLEFFLLFSSGAGVTGNVGQADYAAANAFMDGYASYRNALVARGLRQGRTVAIDWPLWSDGGMRVDAGTERLMADTLGMLPMASEQGVRACYQAMALARDQVMVIAGDADKLRARLCPPAAALPAAAGPAAPAAGPSLRAGVLGQLRLIIGQITGLAPDDIGADDPMDEFGLDSLMVAQLNQKLAAVFGPLSKTLFYEQRSIATLADYLIGADGAACHAWAGTAPMPVAESVPAQAPVQHMPRAPEGADDDGIAIIGMSARFPQADTLEAFWEQLKAGKQVFTEIPSERWDGRAYFDGDRQQAGARGKSYSKWGAFLERFADFDALFFGIAPREAAAIDPQERLFLEQCWHAFEDAGYCPSGLDDSTRARVGVYCGVTKTGFSQWNGDQSPLIHHTSFASLVNRVSYAMDLRGPSVSVDTMCSSAAVALHQACESLRGGQIDMALSGGVNLYLHPRTYVALAQAQLLSGASGSTVFGQGGDGFMPSEGVGAVVLKRLADARRDKDNILAVLRASAVSHAGRTNGFGVPDPERQAGVIRAALESRRIDARTISYIESAATGAEMGDAIEMTALRKVFGDARGDGTAAYRLGSVKACLGHGEAVSGMAQLIKVVLQLRHRTLCPTARPAAPNPDIDFDQLPFALQSGLSEWEAPRVDGMAVPRRAGINSFGAGGVNAHLVVEEYAASRAPVPTPPAEPIVFVLSAKTEQALAQYKRDWSAYLRTHPELDLNALAYTLQTGREPMKRRFACVADSVETLLARLEGGDGDNRASATADTDIEALIAARRYQDLADRWLAGAAVPWRRLYGEQPPARLGQLPTYPFARRRYWIDAPLPAPVPAPAPKAGRFIDVAALLSTLAAEPAPPAPPPSEPGWTRQQVGAQVRAVLCRVLYLDEQDEFDDDANFGELGLTSISVVAFVQELNAQFGLELPETIVFDHTNPRDLGQYLHTLLRERRAAGLAVR
ncbi:MAG: SDR family NAD(P)-dependent oxidoreductase [Gammaproteobacteria bacterium]